MKFNHGAAEGGAACGSAIDLSPIDGQPPKRVQLLGLGELLGRDGRRWKVEGRAHAQAIVDATRARAASQDIAIDYDHQSVFGAKDGVGGQAPAAGWIKPDSLTVESDGIWAAVEWTSRAAASIVAKEYRYLSPFFGFDKAGKVTRIFNAGLTNNPNFELAAVASGTFTEESENMKLLLLPQLAALYGLSATASEDQVLAAATESVAAASAAQTSLKAIATAAGLEETAEATAVASAVADLKGAGAPDPTKFAPKAVVDGLVAQVTALTKGQTEDKATAAVDLAVKEGKLAPALVDSWAKPYALKDLEGFTAWASAAPVVVPPGEREDLSGEPEGGSGVLTAEDKAACSVLGLSEEGYLKTKKDNA